MSYPFSHYWDNIPDTHSLEEKFILSHGWLTPWLAVSKAETNDQKSKTKEKMIAHSSQETEKGGTRDKRALFLIMSASTHL